MKTLFVASVIATVIITPVLADPPSSAGAGYVVSQGTIGDKPVTILLNPSTGKTWFLGEVDANGRVWVSLPIGNAGTATWIPIPFAPQTAQSPPH